jgi:hypothetical protein
LYARNFKEAIPLLEQAIKIHPGEQALIDDLAVGYNLEAISFMKDDSLDQADASLQKVCSLKASDKLMSVTKRISSAVASLRAMAPAQRRAVVNKLQLTAQ